MKLLSLILLCLLSVGCASEKEKAQEAHEKAYWKCVNDGVCDDEKPRNLSGAPVAQIWQCMSGQTSCSNGNVVMLPACPDNKYCAAPHEVPEQLIPEHLECFTGMSLQEVKGVKICVSN